MLQLQKHVEIFVYRGRFSRLLVPLVRTARRLHSDCCSCNTLGSRYHVRLLENRATASSQSSAATRFAFVDVGRVSLRLVVRVRS